MLVVGDNAPAEDGVVSGAVEPAWLKGYPLVAASSLKSLQGPERKAISQLQLPEGQLVANPAIVPRVHVRCCVAFDFFGIVLPPKTIPKFWNSFGIGDSGDLQMK